MASSPAADPLLPEHGVPAALSLNLIGGFLDAFVFTGHGGVFANAQTGNVVFLAINAVAGAWGQAANHVAPILAFVAGVFVMHLLGLDARRSGRRPVVIALWIEAILFLLIALAPAATPDTPIVLGVAFAAALQFSAFNRIGAWTYTSIATTGNLRRFAESLFAGTIPRRDPEALAQARVFGGVCAAFVAGVAAGALLTPRYGNPAMLVTVAAASLILVRCHGLTLSLVRRR